ncbi:hypothetical protein B0A48_01365 [Cryoendolithus antarcticus]|uniref:BTB domain-containing protein n=1 Tax=Cryoendolithus antarcticus TaxID=1507870 RepID=A0A1V8TT55_9PEZI|nr:hypothetical protein B0A48_01365 [Cryoendolithus antarcticus]
METNADTRPTFQATFQVLVGAAPNQKTYTLHDDIFLLRSVYFASARSQAWSKDGEPIDLTDEDPDVFEAYLRYVYLGEPRLQFEEDSWFQVHAALYVLADKLGDLKTANFIIDWIAKCSERSSIPEASEARYVYDHTAEGSHLRRILIDMLLHEWDCQESEDELRNRFPKDVLLDVLQ